MTELVHEQIDAQNALSHHKRTLVLGVGLMLLLASMAVFAWKLVP